MYTISLDGVPNAYRACILTLPSLQSLHLSHRGECHTRVTREWLVTKRNEPWEEERVEVKRRLAVSSFPPSFARKHSSRARQTSGWEVTYLLLCNLSCFQSWIYCPVEEASREFLVHYIVYNVRKNIWSHCFICSDKLSNESLTLGGRWLCTLTIFNKFNSVIIIPALWRPHSSFLVHMDPCIFIFLTHKAVHWSCQDVN